MLDGAFTSPKLRRLSVILGVPWPHAIGLAGLLWRFTAKHAPTGEIGRHDDEEVAAALEWPKEADELIQSLVRCRLLDRVNGPARLIVHDWPDHAPRYVLATLRRRELDYSHHYEPTAVETTGKTTDSTVVETSYTSSSASSSASSSTSALSFAHASGIDSLVDEIWSLWVPGRKTGKAEGRHAILKSIAKITIEFKVTAKEAAAEIAVRTKRDADRYKQQLRNGENELQFIPHGSTYFKAERWLDDDDQEPTKRDGPGELADQDLERIRGS